MPRLITPDEIADGMQLAEPVKNRFGQVMLPANVQLQTKHAGMFKTWGIQAVLIVDDAGQESDKYDESEVTVAKQKLSRRMNWKARNAYEKELTEMALERILEMNN